MDQYDQAEAARKKMFKEMEETWKRQTAENLARYEAWKRSGGDGGDGQRLLTASFTITYGFSCSLTKDAKTGKPYMKSRALQEPVTVEVTPSSIYISLSLIMAASKLPQAATRLLRVPKLRCTILSKPVPTAPTRELHFEKTIGTSVLC
jgi:hypothetical protein